MSRLGAVAMVGFSLSLHTAVASAQQQMSETARSLYQNGAVAFSAGRYAEAVRAFRESHAISHAPELLFNLGLAQERAGDVQGAIESLTDFRNAGAPGADREEIERRLVELRRRAATQSAEARATAQRDEARHAVPSERVVVRTVERNTVRQVEYRRSTLDTIGPWVTLGVGAALGVAAIVQGVVAARDVSAVRDVNSGRSPWSDDIGAAYGRASGEVTRAWVLGSIGGAMVVGGVLWVILRGRGQRHEVTVTPTISWAEGGATLGVGGTL